MDDHSVNPFTPDETSDIARQLAKLRPGYVPHAIFLQLTRIWATSVVEVVPLRKKEGGDVQVLLLPRPNDDPFFSGMLHTPGAVVRATDEGEEYQTVLRRILEHELQNLRVSLPVLVGPLLHKNPRGTESALVYWVEVLEEPSAGDFYNLEDLPPSLIPSQEVFIRRAAGHFLGRT